MKTSLNSITKEPASLPGFYLIRWLQKGKILLAILLACMVCTGCFQHYYKTNSKLQVDTALIEKLKAENKYFIIHADTVIMGMQEVKLVNQKLEARLVELPKERAAYTSPKKNEANNVKAKHQANTCNEVHIYTGESVSSSQSLVAIPLSTINKIAVYEPDEKSTRTSTLLSIAALAVAGFLIAGIIIIGLNPVPL